MDEKVLDRISRSATEDVVAELNMDAELQRAWRGLPAAVRHSIFRQWHHTIREATAAAVIQHEGKEDK